MATRANMGSRKGGYEKKHRPMTRRNTLVNPYRSPDKKRTDLRTKGICALSKYVIRRCYKNDIKNQNHFIFVRSCYHYYFNNCDCFFLLIFHVIKFCRHYQAFGYVQWATNSEQSWAIALWLSLYICVNASILFVTLRFLINTFMHRKVHEYHPRWASEKNRSW